MELYAKGQLSYLILTCLHERDFYGLDIISEISSRSNGRINLKKPSVYSNLTRMEKQGYISAYLQSSDFGPNRKYYSLTEKGRGFYQELKSYFDKNNIDVFRDFQDFDEKPSLPAIENSPAEENTEIKNEENDFFDFSSLNSPIEETTTKDIENSVTEEAKQEEIKLEITEEVVENKTQEDVQPTKDDGVFLSAENVEEYNRRLYDISKDINKIKRKRSFADDQIAMTATAPLYESNERVKSNIEDFKNSILANKEKYNSTSSFDYFKQKESQEVIDKAPVLSTNTPLKLKEEEKDDAKFITGRIDASEIEHAKKIEPPRLKIVSENTKDTRLPAPKRDKAIDPSHREILNELYLRTKDGSSVETREDAIYDYNDLADYYKSQNISFNVYSKSMSKASHNTNKLYFINSVLAFLMVALLSTALYLVFNKIYLTYDKTNFLYILLPALMIIDVLYKFYNYKNYSGWIPSQLRPQWQVWLLYILASLAVTGLNFACGMATKPFELYATTLVLPLTLLLVMLPIRYYLKRLILVKFWK